MVTKELSEDLNFLLACIASQLSAVADDDGDDDDDDWMCMRLCVNVQTHVCRSVCVCGFRSEREIFFRTENRCPPPYYCIIAAALSENAV